MITTPQTKPAEAFIAAGVMAKHRIPVTILRTYDDLGGTAVVRFDNDVEGIVRTSEIDYRTKDEYRAAQHHDLLIERVRIFRTFVTSDLTDLKPSKFNLGQLQNAVCAANVSLRTLFENLREARQLGLI